MNILQLWEAIKDDRQFFCKCFLCEFDLASIETSYATDLKSSSDLCGKAPLRPAQDDI